MTGSPPRHRRRDPPIHQTIRDVAHALPHLQLRRRDRNARRSHEVLVRSLRPLHPPRPIALLPIRPRPGSYPTTIFNRLTFSARSCRYKGMSHTSQPTSATSRTISPQATGFSQIHSISRGGGEGGGQAMSVLLSWHEKLVEIAGQGSIIRVMTDRRTV